MLGKIALPSSRASRSWSALITVSVMVSPVFSASDRASRSASGCLIFRDIFEFCFLPICLYSVSIIVPIQAEGSKGGLPPARSTSGPMSMVYGCNSSNRANRSRTRISSDGMDWARAGLGSKNAIVFRSPSRRVKGDRKNYENETDRRSNNEPNSRRLLTYEWDTKRGKTTLDPIERTWLARAWISIPGKSLKPSSHSFV